MKKAELEYRCRRCGTLRVVPGFSEDEAIDTLLHPEDSIHGIHCCEDGGKGLSDLQGYRIK